MFPKQSRGIAVHSRFFAKAVDGQFGRSAMSAARLLRAPVLSRRLPIFAKSIVSFVWALFCELREYGIPITISSIFSPLIISFNWVRVFPLLIFNRFHRQNDIDAYRQWPDPPAFSIINAQIAHKIILSKSRSLFQSK